MADDAPTLVIPKIKNIKIEDLRGIDLDSPSEKKPLPRRNLKFLPPHLSSQQSSETEHIMLELQQQMSNDDLARMIGQSSLDPEEEEEKNASRDRQMQALNQRFNKGKITEKNYLHQLQQIMA